MTKLVNIAVTAEARQWIKEKAVRQQKPMFQVVAEAFMPLDVRMRRDPATSAMSEFTERLERNIHTGEPSEEGAKMKLDDAKR